MSEVLTSDWRMVQVFLGDEGVYEVEVDSVNKSAIRCTCKTFKSRPRCEHTRHVKRVMENNDGHYTVSIPEIVDEQEALLAMGDADLFRKFIIKYGKVEVL